MASRDLATPVIRRRMAALICAVAVLPGGCAGGRRYLAAEGRPHAELLADCTERTARHFERPVPAIPPQARKQAIRAASLWAYEHCYAPCEYTMCGSVTGFDDGSVAVYVSYDVAEEIPRAEDGVIVVRTGPEAEVTFSRGQYRAKEEIIFHSGCRWSTDDCDMQRVERVLRENRP